jgi:hypothetical protein
MHPDSDEDVICYVFREQSDDSDNFRLVLGSVSSWPFRQMSRSIPRLCTSIVLSFTPSITKSKGASLGFYLELTMTTPLSLSLIFESFTRETFAFSPKAPLYSSLLRVFRTKITTLGMVITFLDFPLTIFHPYLKFRRMRNFHAHTFNYFTDGTPFGHKAGNSVHICNCYNLNRLLGL